jgi:hypothetical protein
MAAIAPVVLYMLFTIPFLGLLFWVLRERGAYTRLFLWGILLQLIPIGLLFWPGGLVGLGVLAYALATSGRRNWQLGVSGLHHPEVERKWSREYRAGLVAMACALEQKGAAWLFMDVVGRRGFGLLWSFLVPASLVMWLAVAGLLAVETRRLRRRHQDLAPS